MKKIMLLIFCLYFFTGCDSQKALIENAQTYKNFRGFEPTDATEYDAKVTIVENNGFVNKEIRLLTPLQILSFLNNETVLVSIGRIDVEGNITYVPVTLSAKSTSYKITMDYMKFATIGQVGQDGRFLGYKRVGVGLRLISQITTFESGINIGDLSSIGLAAKAGKLNGTLMIEIIGIKSKEVTTLLPLPSEINQTTIQNAMQALATIKSKIYDDQTALYPQVMAVKLEKSDTIISAISKGDEVAISKDLNSTASILQDDKVKLQFVNNPATSSQKFQAADKFVTDGFDYIFSKDVNSAIQTFNECEKIYPGLYSVYEINQLLKTNENSLQNKNSKKWKEIASTIIEKFSWKLSNRIMDNLKKMRDE